MRVTVQVDYGEWGSRFLMAIGEINFVISPVARHSSRWLIGGDSQETSKLFIRAPIASQMLDDIDLIQHPQFQRVTDFITRVH